MRTRRLARLPSLGLRLVGERKRVIKNRRRWKALEREEAGAE